MLIHRLTHQRTPFYIAAKARPSHHPSRRTSLPRLFTTMAAPASKPIYLVGLDNAPPPIQTKLDAAYTQVREAGYTLEIVPLHPETISAELEALRDTLRAKPCRGFVVGAGVRTRLELREMFERLVNVAAEVVPGVRFGFPSSPEDLFECVERNFGGK